MSLSPSQGDWRGTREIKADYTLYRQTWLRDAAAAAAGNDNERDETT